MAKFRSNDLHNFTFVFTGYGHYKVTYKHDVHDDYWCATISDMTLIDATKNADCAKLKDIVALYQSIKRNGTHYNRHGIPID